MSAMKEEQIVQLVQNGEHEAYRHLVERYQAGVIIFCENVVKDRATAEDIAQTAFIKAYQSIGSYSASSGRFSTWLYAIAANCARDYLRKHKKTLALDTADVVVADPPALSQAEKAEIRAAVKALQPPEYAEVIDAYFWQGLSYEQIAAIMKVPVGTIGSWIKRAKSQLRKELS